MDVKQTHLLPPGVEEIFIHTADQERLQCYWLPNDRSNYLLIYFHGNAGNISHRLPDLCELHAMGLSVLGMGYRGYGKSTGKPNEQGIYKDGTAAYEYAMNRLGFSEKYIILLGRSIGSTVAVETALHHTPAALILVSPMTSGKQMARQLGLGFLAPLAGRSFDNLAKISKIRSPLLIIHGTADEIIPFAMGRTLYTAAQSQKQFAPIKRAGHNNLALIPGNPYWQAVNQFIEKIQNK